LNKSRPSFIKESINSLFNSREDKTFVRPSRSVYYAFFCGIALTAFLCLLNFTQQVQYQNAVFEKEVTKIQNGIRNRYHTFGLLTQSTANFFTAQEMVTLDEWMDYVSKIFSNKEYLGLYDVSYIKYVNPEHLVSYKKIFNDWAKKYYPQKIFDFFPKTPVSDYCIVAYGTNKDLLGYNACSNTVLKNELLTQEKRDIYQLIGIDHYPGEDAKNPNIHFISSVSYPKNLSKNIAQDKFRGWVLLSVKTKDFFEKIMPPDFIVEIYDMKDNTRLIYSNRGTQTESKIEKTVPIFIGNHVLQIKVIADADSALFHQPIVIYIAFALGVILSFLLAWLLWSVNKERLNAENLAEKIRYDLHLTQIKNNSIVANIPGAVYRSFYENGNWVIEFMSDAIHEITGYNAKHFIGKNLISSMAIDKKDHQYMLEAIGHKPIPGHSFSIEHKIQCANGKIRWVSETGRIISHQGLRTHVIGIVFDITESREHRENTRNLRLALENAVEGIAIINQKHSYSNVNKAYADMYGYTEEEMEGMICVNGIHPDEAKNFESTYKKSHDKRYESTIRALRKDGSTFYKHFVMIPIFSDEGYFKGNYCFAQDVTESVLRERELAKALETAKRANTAKNEFVATMSHELRTPLNAIIGYSELLMEDMNPRSSNYKDLHKIRLSGQHLLTLINSVLDFSKLEAGKLEIYTEEIDINKLAKTVIEIVKPAAKNNSNKLILECPNTIGKMHSDFTRIRQCLLNLLSNACKFTKKGKITLKVYTKSLRNEEFVCFAIKDTGVGVSPGQLKKLFKPFSQADSSTTRRFGGTGLGLSITKRFAELLRGKIEVDTEYNKGSTFTVMFPRYAQTPEQVSSKVKALTR
jgi:PAS domain S-box-containing protein